MEIKDATQIIEDAILMVSQTPKLGLRHVNHGNVGRGFHYTRKGPGRVHNNSTTELRLKHLPADIQFKERERLNRWPTRVAKFYNRFGFCPVTPVLDL